MANLIITYWRDIPSQVAVKLGRKEEAARTLGGALGPPDPDTVAETAEVGTTVDGALGLRALGVLCAPALTALGWVGNYVP